MRHKKSDRNARRDAKRSGQHPEQAYTEVLPPSRLVKPMPFEAKNDKQRKYASAMRQPGGIVFGMGPAGSGKSYVAACMAADALMERRVERIILTRPAIEAGGEELGFLPGEKEEKFETYYDPFRDALEERLGKSFVELLIKDGRIKCEPFANKHNKTNKQTIVILD